MKFVDTTVEVVSASPSGDHVIRVSASWSGPEHVRSMTFRGSEVASIYRTSEKKTWINFKGCAFDPDDIFWPMSDDRHFQLVEAVFGRGAAGWRS